MDYTTWVFTAGTAVACSGILWIGQTLHSLQIDNAAGRLKDANQDNSIAVLLKREEVNRTLLQTIVTKLSVLEYRLEK